MESRNRASSITTRPWLHCEKPSHCCPTLAWATTNWDWRCFETGDWKAAAPEFEAAVARAPRWADAHFSLAAVYARIDRVPDAMTELDIVLGLSPDHYRANLLRGRILSLQGNPPEGFPTWRELLKFSPTLMKRIFFWPTHTPSWAETQMRSANAPRRRACRLRPNTSNYRNSALARKITTG